MTRAGRLSELNDRQTFPDIMSTVLKYVVIVVMLMIIANLSGKAYTIGYNIFSQETVAPKGQGQEATVEIKEGMSVSEVGNILEENGLIRDASVFPFQERFSSCHGKLMPGVYTLSSDMTPEDMMGVMAESHVPAEDGSNTGIGTRGEGSTGVDMDSIREMLGI